MSGALFSCSENPGSGSVAAGLAWIFLYFSFSFFAGLAFICRSLSNSIVVLWIAVRPSGTEPKIKIYYSIKGTDKAEAEKELEEIQNAIKRRLGL